MSQMNTIAISHYPGQTSITVHVNSQWEIQKFSAARAGAALWIAQAARGQQQPMTMMRRCLPLPMEG